MFNSGLSCLKIFFNQIYGNENSFSDGTTNQYQATRWEWRFKFWKFSATLQSTVTFNPTDYPWIILHGWISAAVFFPLAFVYWFLRIEFMSASVTLIVVANRFVNGNSLVSFCEFIQRSFLLSFGLLRWRENMASNECSNNSLKNDSDEEVMLIKVMVH